MKCIGISVYTSSWDVNLIPVRCVILCENSFANQGSCSGQLFFNSLRFAHVLYLKIFPYDFSSKKHRPTNKIQNLKNTKYIGIRLNTHFDTETEYFRQRSESGGRPMLVKRRRCRCWNDIQGFVVVGGLLVIMSSRRRRWEIERKILVSV